MRNVIKIVSSVSSAALLLSGAAMAGAPVGFSLDSWSVSATGAIVSTCPAVPCSPLASGNGFEQTQFSIGGKTYIRTILAEGWSTTATTPQAPGSLKFTDENLVQIGVAGVAAAQGLISRTRIVDAGAVNPPPIPAIGNSSFLGESTIETGWGTGTVAGAGDPARTAEVAIRLDVSERPALVAGNIQGANDFLSKFAFTGYTNVAGLNVVDSLNMDQTIYLNGTTAASALTDRQRFVSSSKLAGAAPIQATPAAPGFKFAANTTTPATYLTWLATQPIQAVWVAQQVSNANSTSSGLSPFTV